MIFCVGLLIGIIVMMLEWFRESNNDASDLHENVLKSIREIECRLWEIENQLYAFKKAKEAEKAAH